MQAVFAACKAFGGGNSRLQLWPSNCILVPGRLERTFVQIILWRNLNQRGSGIAGLRGVRSLSSTKDDVGDQCGS
jgi:hypothetical protein